MEKVRVVEARRPEAIGRTVCVQGWIRTRRDSKGGFSFLEVNDGSCLGNLQVIAEASLPNYEAELKRFGRLQRHGRRHGQGSGGQGKRRKSWPSR